MDPLDLSSASLRLEMTGRRADVVLDDPAHRNAQTPAMWRALAQLAERLDGQVDVVVISGAGPSFSAGLHRSAFAGNGEDPDSLPALARAPEPEVDRQIALFQEAFTRWSTSSFVTIAAVRGHAVGAGFQLALAADLILATPDARFAILEPTLGLVPDLGGTGRLLELVGYSRALEICATGRQIPADEALALGLVTEVVPEDQLGPAVDALAAPFLGAQRGAVLATRELLREGARRTAADDDGRAAQLAAERRAQIGRLRSLLG